MKKTFTFYRLFKCDSDGYSRVEIPIIQRDYVQGRTDENTVIVRKDFLNSLIKALGCPPGDPKLPLDLDFVYGSVVERSFQPLDGQQRLTTLFLLHWYIAWMDGRIDEFQAHFAPGGQSRLSYKIRPSSEEFINELAKYNPKEAAMDCPDVREMICDQPWYFRSWQFDPTIQSVLLMLEQMHKHRGLRNESGLYARLIDESAPAITFQLLELKDFNLSDDLYIKMNARGKLLTPFENFKARFEQHLESEHKALRLPYCKNIPIFRFFSRKIDQDYSDFLWQFRDKKENTFDGAIMNLIRAVIIVTRSPKNKSTDKHLAELRNPNRIGSYAWFYENSWLDEEMIIALITLLERWNAKSQRKEIRCYLPEKCYMGEIGENAFFKKIINQPTELTSEQLVQLAGYVLYMVRAGISDVDPKLFNNWMRVVFNLSVNTIYDEQVNLKNSFEGLRDLGQHMNYIVRHLAGRRGYIKGFRQLQVAEERIKSHLLGFGELWAERICKAEKNWYFKGQIGFILCFCNVNLDRPDEEIAKLDSEAVGTLASSFDHYFECAQKMFDDLKNDPNRMGRLWERALLAVGDYLLKVRQNWSLLTLDLDRDRSWKRLLRNAAAEDSRQGQVLKKLWDHLDSPASFENDLLQIIESNSNIDSWRRVIVSTPDVFNFGNYRMLRFLGDNRIYLLNQTQMNGLHAELFTYCAYKELEALAQLQSQNIKYECTNSTGEEPYLSIEQRFRQDYVTFYLERSWRNIGGYELYVDEIKELDGNLHAILENDGFEVVSGSEVDKRLLTKNVDRDEIKAAVLALGHLLAQ